MSRSHHASFHSNIIISFLHLSVILSYSSQQLSSLPYSYHIALNTVDLASTPRIIGNYLFHSRRLSLEAVAQLALAVPSLRHDSRRLSKLVGTEDDTLITFSRSARSP